MYSHIFVLAWGRKSVECKGTTSCLMNQISFQNLQLALLSLDKIQKTLRIQFILLLTCQTLIECLLSPWECARHQDSKIIATAPSEQIIQTSHGRCFDGGPRRVQNKKRRHFWLGPATQSAKNEVGQPVYLDICKFKHIFWIRIANCKNFPVFQPETHFKLKRQLSQFQSGD